MSTLSKTSVMYIKVPPFSERRLRFVCEYTTILDSLMFSPNAISNVVDKSLFMRGIISSMLYIVSKLTFISILNS